MDSLIRRYLKAAVAFLAAGLALRWAVVLSGLAQIAGIGVFFHTMWSRIRPVGSQAREARGERF